MIGSQPARRALAGAIGLLALLCSSAHAQHTGDMGSAPPPPRGDGRLTVEIVHEADPGSDAVTGIAIALYALAPDGSPGFLGGQTDATGRHTFEGISTDPGIVYLLGARYEEIPFGERVTFAPGEKEARVEIRISSPSDDLTGVTIEELRARIDWMGDRIVVTELLRFTNPSQRVIQLPADDATRSISVRPLPANARDFSPGPSSIGDGLAFSDGKVRFWGPLYPGDQRVEYQYSIPLSQGDRELSLPIQLRDAAARVVLVAGTAGLDVQGEGLIESREVAETDSAGSAAGAGATTRSSWARSGLAAGERFDVALTLPESRRDPSLVSVPRGDVWVEVDDTRLTARVDIQLQVADGPPVSGTPDAPLFHVSIPAGAKLNGVAPEAEGLGLEPTDDGGFDVIGPIGPGTTSLGYSYEMPSRSDGIEMGMRFPREVSTLNVLIADTGLALDSGRLHRRRPFRSGTRNFLHREAYNVSPDEIVDLSIRPLRATGLPAGASVALTIAAAAAGAFFLINPLRSARREVLVDVSEAARIQAEREAVYSSIHDLDHDFETGKLEDTDYAEMREDLRRKAIELLRAERASEHGAGVGTEAERAPTAAPASRAPSEAADVSAAGVAAATVAPTSDAPRIGTYCPGCGVAIKNTWRFCSNCGEALEPAEENKG